MGNNAHTTEKVAWHETQQAKPRFQPHPVPDGDGWARHADRHSLRFHHDRVARGDEPATDNASPLEWYRRDAPRPGAPSAGSRTGPPLDRAGGHHPA